MFLGSLTFEETTAFWTSGYSSARTGGPPGLRVCVCLGRVGLNMRRQEGSRAEVGAGKLEDQGRRRGGGCTRAGG